MPTLITATFKTRTAAEDTLKKLENIAVTEDQVGLLISDETRGKSFSLEKQTKADENAAAGATFGGLVGAVLAAVAGAGTVAVPGFVVTGPLAAALAGMGAGAATGGVIGLLSGLGIDEHEAKLYEDSLKQGKILLAVDPENEDQAEEIETVLRKVDAYNIAA